MKQLTYLSLSLFLLGIIGCSSSKNVKPDLPIEASHAYFQNWTTEISIGSSGTNIFIGNLTAKNNVTIDSVYFRKMKGKLIEGRSLYSSQLVRMLPNSQANKLTTEGFIAPIELANNECAVGYTENGETKYYKITNVAEREGVHYKYGPPKKL